MVINVRLEKILRVSKNKNGKGGRKVYNNQIQTLKRINKTLDLGINQIKEIMAQNIKIQINGMPNSSGDNIPDKNLKNLDRRQMIERIQQMERRQSLQTKKKKELVGISSGEWTLRQIKLYHRFLSTHIPQFTDPMLRKRNKVFIKLADFIGSRTPDQCRSHHQKATKKFPLFQKLLQHYISKILKLQKLQEQLISDNRNQQKTHQEVQLSPNHQAKIEKPIKLQVKEQIEEIDQKKCENMKQKNQKPTGYVSSMNFYTLYMNNKRLQRIELDSCCIEEYH